MKITNKIVVTIISLFLLAFTNINASTFATPQIDSQTVRDISGKRLERGVKYYILPVIRGRGGGVEPSIPKNKSTCPLNVVQARSEISKGIPVTFSPAVINKQGRRFISLSADLNIKFSSPKKPYNTKCSSVWRLVDEPEPSSRRFVGTGGVEGNPGPSTLSNWFKIDRNEDQSSDIGGYKIVFCPTVCNFCKVICRDVGVIVDGYGVKKLGFSLTETIPPLLVRFKRA